MLRFDAAVRRDAFVVEAELTVRPGETVAIVGPNGAGKSTLLQAVAGFVGIERGRIESGGRLLDDGVRALPPEARDIGLVPQDRLLFPHLTVRGNVQFGPRSRGASRAEARGAADAVLERLGIAHLAARRPGALSGGQAQRVAIARAVAASGSLLLLDEPLAALDVAVRETVRGVLREELDRYTGAAVLVTHDLVDVVALADRAVVLEEGRVSASGTIAELREAPATPYLARLLAG